MSSPQKRDDSPQTERQIVDRISSLLEQRLPNGWRLDRTLEPKLGGGARADAIFSILAPGGATAAVLVEVKRGVEIRDVPRVRAQIERYLTVLDRPATGMIAARYLSAGARERILAEGLNYVDATGNIYLALEKPAIFLRDAGAERDPWRGPGRPRDSFRGPIAARVVRALADYAPPLTVPRLIELSGVSTGAGYRVVDFLERQDLLERGSRGPITRVEWRQMIELWSRDYALNLEGGDSRWLAPRGVPSVLSGLGEIEEVRYALTGSAAAAYFEEYAQTRLAMVYCDDPPALASRLNLRPVEAGANVVLLRPQDDVVYQRTVKRAKVVVAAPSQIAGDLLNGPGRAPAEAEALLDWMERDESSWRH